MAQRAEALCGQKGRMDSNDLNLTTKTSRSAHDFCGKDSLEFFLF
jgi:hypothetical protein